MSAGTSVVMAIIFLGFLIVSATVYSLIDYSKNLVKNAQYDQDNMKKSKMQTDITITNITLTNITADTSRMNITIKNTGKTTLNASSMNIFVGGSLYNYTLLTAGNTWVPENRTDISIYPVNYTDTTGSRIKVVTANGISDYAFAP